MLSDILNRARTAGVSTLIVSVTVGLADLGFGLAWADPNASCTAIPKPRHPTGATSTSKTAA
jgi:hypothetical protein